MSHAHLLHAIKRMRDRKLREWFGTLGYVEFVTRDLGDGRYAAVHPLIYEWALIVGQIGDETGYEDSWYYLYGHDALAALIRWDAERGPEPDGWFRNPKTGRRRKDGMEYIQW